MAASWRGSVSGGSCSRAAKPSSSRASSARGALVLEHGRGLARQVHAEQGQGLERRGQGRAHLALGDVEAQLELVDGHLVEELAGVALEII